MVHAIYITPSLRPYKGFLCYYYCQMNPINQKKSYCQINGVNPLLFKTKTHTHTQGRGNVVLTSNKKAFHKLYLKVIVTFKGV